MIIDAFTYNGELEMLRIHLESLDRMVDKFVIVESKTTFSGNKKQLYFLKHERFVEKYWPKIEYHIVNEDYSTDEILLAETSPNTKGARHWKNEFLQKESIKKALARLDPKDDDIVYVGDVDEIWEPYDPIHPTKLKLLVYAYYLNQRSTEQFWGTLVAKYGDIKDACLNHLRTNPHFKTEDYYGWHFTSMGGLSEVRRKLNDSYTTESYNTYEVQMRLPERLKKGVDYLGRDFQFTIDEASWPLYLQRNRSKFSHLCLKPQQESTSETMKTLQPSIVTA